MSLSVDDIVGKFPHKKLRVIQGEPTYATIYEIIQIMYANAAAVPTTLGGEKPRSHWPRYEGLSLRDLVTFHGTDTILGPFPTFNPNVRYTQGQRKEIVRQHKQSIESRTIV